MISRMYRCEDGPKIDSYKGFEQLQNGNQQLTGNAYVAIVQNEDDVEMWVCDNAYSAVDELRRYYAEQEEHLRQPVAVVVTQVCRYVTNAE